MSAIKSPDESRRTCSPLIVTEGPPGSSVWLAITTCFGLIVYVLDLIVTAARVLANVALGDPAWLTVGAVLAYVVSEKKQNRHRIKECGRNIVENYDIANDVKNGMLRQYVSICQVLSSHRGGAHSAASGVI